MVATHCCLNYRPKVFPLVSFSRKAKLVCCFLLLTFEFLLSPQLPAQNLLPNPGFEDINRCVEYHAECAPEAWFNVSATNYLVKGKIAPRPVIGQMVLLLPVGNVLPSFKKPRFTYTLLLCPLVKGTEYELSVFIHTGGKPFGGLELFFMDKEPTLFSLSILNRSFSVPLMPADVDDELKGWKHISKKFTATGNESFLLLPNKSINAETYAIKDAMNSSGDVFYFLDEVILKPVTPTVLCEQSAENKLLLYAHNYRHMDIPLIVEVIPVAPVPVITRDTITIPSVLFDVNSAALKPAVKKILDSVAAVISNHNSTQVDINGHTDNTGSVEKNEQLALNRATAVRNYLAGKLPALAASISAAGKGQSMPIADNNTAEGRARNRRVEVIIKRFVTVP